MNKRTSSRSKVKCFSSYFRRQGHLTIAVFCFRRLCKRTASRSKVNCFSSRFHHQGHLSIAVLYLQNVQVNIAKQDEDDNQTATRRRPWTQDLCGFAGDFKICERLVQVENRVDGI